MVPASSGTFIWHSHMMLTIYWILMYLLVTIGTDRLHGSHVCGSNVLTKISGLEKDSKPDLKC